MKNYFYAIRKSYRGLEVFFHFSKEKPLNVAPQHDLRLGLIENPVFKIFLKKNEKREPKNKFRYNRYVGIWNNELDEFTHVAPISKFLPQNLRGQAIPVDIEIAEEDKDRYVNMEYLF